jgi:hypothetical protein
VIAATVECEPPPNRFGQRQSACQIFNQISIRLGLAGQEVPHEHTEIFIELALHSEAMVSNTIDDFPSRIPCKNRNLAFWNSQRDIFEIILTSAMQFNEFLNHFLLH